MLMSNAMNQAIRRSRSWTRRFHSSFRQPQSSHCASLSAAPVEHTGLDEFRNRAFIAKKPFLFGKDSGSVTNSLPAASKWFINAESHDRDSTNSSSAWWQLAPYMHKFREWPFPYELVIPTPQNQEALVAFRSWLLSNPGSTQMDLFLASLLETPVRELGQHMFFQLHAPLQLLLRALQFNKKHTPDRQKLLELYIAQSSLPDLPPPLQDDLPTPAIVQQAGKGDVYGSSIWLGTEPTYTPLHRDPNPNIFGQLCGTKLVRLMPPSAGDRLFHEVQARLHQNANSRIRSLEMMEGEEREALHEAVWERDPALAQMIEAELGPGDSLFIPNSWWHSVKSKGSEGGLNGSVNWWFR